MLCYNRLCILSSFNLASGWPWCSQLRQGFFWRGRNKWRKRLPSPLHRLLKVERIILNGFQYSFKLLHNGILQITSEETLCCCYGELCNQPNLKLFQNTIKTEGHGKWSAQTNIIFFSAVIIVVSLALALIGYSFRRRKTALKNRNAQEKIPIARKSTKNTVMQTRWMKEDPQG